jgi:hypothetical protein
MRRSKAASGLAKGKSPPSKVLLMCRLGVWIGETAQNFHMFCTDD